MGTFLTAMEIATVHTEGKKMDCSTLLIGAVEVGSVVLNVSMALMHD